MAIAAAHRFISQQSMLAGIQVRTFLVRIGPVRISAGICQPTNLFAHQFMRLVTEQSRR